MNINEIMSLVEELTFRVQTLEKKVAGIKAADKSVEEGGYWGGVGRN